MKYRWKRRPYAHQVLAIKKLLGISFGGALLCEPRTGKTKIAVDYASIRHLQGKVNRVLVFTPVNGLGVWEDEIRDNCPVKHRVMVWDKKTRKGRRRRGVQTPTPLPVTKRGVLDFVIVNYDALSTPGTIRGYDKEGNILRSRSTGGRFTIKKQIIKWQPQLIILDESHRIKTPSARKSTAIHSLQKVPEYRMIMTGTVVTKKKRIFDIYSQWKFLNPERFGDMTFAQFKDHYGRWLHKDGYDKWLHNINEHELHRMIHRDGYSITREECYDMPAATHQLLHVDLDTSGPIYDRMASDMVARIKTGEFTEASIQLVLNMRLRHISSGISKVVPTPEHPSGEWRIIGSEKLRALRSRLEDLLELDEKVVIGAAWRLDIARIQKLCQLMKVPVFVVKGGMKRHEREYARTQFPKVDGGAVFIGQPASAGEAIDLSSSSIMIWYSLTLSWVNYRQFCDRIALSDRPTFYEYILARGTVDEMVYQVLQEDGDIGKMMITSPERLLRMQEQSH